MRETVRSHDAEDEDDGVLPMFDAVTIIVLIDFADDGCSDESDGEVKVELA